MADVKWSVYIHTCPNGKKYIGITSRACEDRWRNGHGYRNNRHFYAAIIKYGWNNIKHEIIADQCLTKEEAQKMEMGLIEAYASCLPAYGYNHSRGGEGKTGFVPTAETRDKIRTKLRGKPRPVEVRVKVAAAHLGKRLSDEHKAKIKKSCKNINAKAVVCLTTGECYPSAATAARVTGISRSGITACCRGEKPSCRNTVWVYVERGCEGGQRCEMDKNHNGYFR